MARQLPGIHHVTAIAGDPQQNVDFYSGVLGLRLVKLTVNFDDPETYHLYYGTGEGAPGTIVTFFPWPGAPRGRRGAGQVTAIAFSVPQGSLGAWVERLKERKIPVEGPGTRFEDNVLWVRDPDGLWLELVECADERAPWAEGAVPAEFAIRGIYGVTLSEEGYERTAALLRATLGFEDRQGQGNRFRYRTGVGGPGAVLDVECVPDLGPGRLGVGTVHHVAWRTPADAEQREWRSALAVAGLDVTPVMDRKYFHSIYFREPGGALFEVATDPPGFAVDEEPSELGGSLKLPEWLEAQRKQIELRLPPLKLPRRAMGA